MDSIVKEDLDLMSAKDIAQYLANRDDCEVTLQYKAVPTGVPAGVPAGVPEEVPPLFEQMLARADAPTDQLVQVQVKPGLRASTAPAPQPVEQMPPPPVDYIGTPAQQPTQPPPVEQPVQQPPVEQSVQPSPVIPPSAALPTSAIEIVRANTPLIQGCDEGTLMRICQEGGYDADPMVLASEQYTFKDISLGHEDRSRLAYLQCAAATAVHEQPILLTKFGLTPTV